MAGDESRGFRRWRVRVVNLIRWEKLSDVILCGHSYGGFVIRAVADRIRALVYLDGFVPQNGERLFDLEARQRAHGVDVGWKVLPIPAKAVNVNPHRSRLGGRTMHTRVTNAKRPRLSN